MKLKNMRANNAATITCLLAVMACICVLTSGWSLTFYSLLLVGSGLALYWAYDCLTNTRKITMYSVFRLAIAGGYCVGTLVAVIYWWGGPKTTPKTLVGPFAFSGYQPYDSWALATIFVILTVTSILHSVASVSLRSVDNIFHNTFSRFDLKISLIALLLVTVGYAMGDIGYMGVVAHADEHITVLGGLDGVIGPALLSVLVYGIVTRGISGFSRVILFVMLAAMFVLLIPQGRRVVLYSCYVAVIMGVYSRPEFARLLSVNKLLAHPMRLIGGVTLIGLVLLTFYAFYAIRVATWDTSNATLTRSVLDADRVATSESFLSEAGYESAARPGTLLGYLGQLEASPRESELKGNVLLGNAVNAVPRVFIRDKQRMISKIPNSDEAVNDRFGLPQIDSPTTLITSGYADFGIYGAILYVCLISFCFSVSTKILTHVKITSLRIFVLSSLMYSALSVEQSISYYFVEIRNLLLITMSVIFLKKLLDKNNLNNSYISIYKNALVNIERRIFKRYLLIWHR